jgi:hypothetical protein
MRGTITLRSWQRIGKREFEYACDYYYVGNKFVGNSDLYYNTGKAR